MSRSRFMPELDRNPSFPIGRACIDRTEVKIDGFSIRGINALEALHSFIHEAGLPIGDPEQRLFHSTSISRLRHPFLVGTSTGRNEGVKGSPVFIGKMEGRGGSAGVLRFSFDSKMNVTRAIQAQRLIGRIDAVQPRRRGNYSLQLSKSERNWHDEYALTKEDNLLIGPDLRFSYAMSRTPSAHFLELLHNVARAISEPLREAADRHNAQAEVSLNYTLKGLEVYWEFSTPYPVSTVDLLAPKLQGAVNRSRTTARAVKLVENGRLQQSWSIQIDLGREMMLRVYAKTNKRVRFEISWGRVAIAREAGRRSELNAEGLVEAVDRLVARSSERLTELFNEMSPPVYGTVQSRTVDDLLRAVAKAHPDPAICAMVLDGLRHNDRIVPEGCQPLLEAVRRLKRQRVLRVIRPYQGWYGLTPQYAEALEALRV